MKKMNVVRKKSIKIVFVSVALLLVAMFAFLKSRTYDPMPEALAIYNEAIDSGQAESGKKFVLFKPPAANSGKNSACFVFYQGALVEELSYVPLMQGIANEGVPSYLISMPLNIAMLSVNAADLAKADPYAKQHCQRFVIGGHSLGGVAASMYLSSYPDDDLLLLASWPAEGKPLLEHKGRIVSIHASNDGLITPDEIEESTARLPKSTKWVMIEGANHAQFGWYGDQAGDDLSAISRQEQQDQVLNAVSELFQ